MAGQSEKQVMRRLKNSPQPDIAHYLLTESVRSRNSHMTGAVRHQTIKLKGLEASAIASM
jgi:hypothetical protein